MIRLTVEETKLANEIDYTDKPSNYNRAEDYMYAKFVINQNLIQWVKELFLKKPEYLK